MIDISTFKFHIKSYIPFFNSRWYDLTKILAHWAADSIKEFSFDEENEVPVATRYDGLKLYGFKNTPREERLIIMLQNNSIFKAFDKKYFRLLSDIICRYKFPHLRPDLSPQTVEDPNPDIEYMEGFHGQHRDTIFQVSNLKLRQKLFNIFLPKQEDIIIDCGSYIGFGALSLSPFLKKGKIFAVEASKNCYDILIKNVESNEIKNINYLKSAIWSDNKTKMSLTTGGAQANSLIKNFITDHSKTTNEELIKCTTIDSLVKNENLEKINMISLTLNGAEVEALLGAKNTLENLRPRLRIAGWYKRDNEYICDICKRYLENLDYFVYIGPKRGVLAVPLEKI